MANERYFSPGLEKQCWNAENHVTDVFFVRLGSGAVDSNHNRVSKKTLTRVTITRDEIRSKPYMLAHDTFLPFLDDPLS
jgi:hypothetical protein